MSQRNFKTDEMTNKKVETGISLFVDYYFALSNKYHINHGI